MAIVTWDGSSSTDYGTAANWDTGSVPTSSDDVIIANVSNDCVLDGSRSVKSFVVETGGDFNGNAEILTVVGENSSGFAVDIDGDIVGTNTMITITTPTTTSVDFNATAGNVRDVTINHASCVVNSENSCVLSRNLNVTLGEFKTNGNVLTVPGSISGNGTLTASTSTVTVTGQTTVATVNITTGTFNYFDDYRPTTSNITDNATFNQTSVGGQLGGRIIITASKTPTFNAVGRLHSSLDIQSGEQGNSTINLDLSENQTGPSRALFFHNLELDSQDTENNTFTMAGAITCTGNLTITDGIIDTSSSDHALTVAGRTDIGPGSGGADQATLTCNASTVSLGSGRTSSHALIINQGGTFVGGSGAHTIGSIDVKNNSNAKCTLTSGNTTVNSEKTGDDRNMVIAGSSTFAHGGGTIIVTFAGTTHYDIDKTINNLTLNNASLVQKLSDSSVLAGNLTITAGQFNANGRNLTVAGDVDVTGTLTGSSGAMSFGSLTIASGGTYSATSGTTTITNEVSGAFALDKHASGTFNHNSGTVEVTTNTNTFIDGFEGTVTSGSGANALNNLIVNLSDSASYHFRLRPNSGTAHTILGNLTVTQGMFELETDSHTLTVNGDVSVGANGTLGRLAKTGNDSFGSLTIASGGTYNATSGTTTITGEVAATDYSWKNDGGTFTHNNGKVLLTEDSDCKVKENTFYDFELNLNSATTDCVFEDTSGNTLTFLGDLTLTRGRFDDDANGDEYIIHGNTIIESNAKFGKATNWHTGDITHHGLVVLNGGTYYRSDAGGTVKMGGIRNIGGSIL